jgi:hypothetical protein|tara:strand:+ start:11547 stop:11813 length:267 start_codon:yes stop_codon:yes gene_type:complete
MNMRDIMYDKILYEIKLLGLFSKETMQWQNYYIDDTGIKLLCSNKERKQHQATAIHLSEAQRIHFELLNDTDLLETFVRIIRQASKQF